MLPLYFILAAVGGYLLGSVPFGLVITKAAGLGDIRSIGSGNIGATNVLRTGRKDLALATLLLDAGKAGIALLIARWLSDGMPQQTLIELTAGTAAFVGHCFPVWLKFKGGKGVATFFGLLFAGYWPLALLAGVVWLAIATIFRYSSLAALAAVAITPIAAMVAGVPEHAAFTAAIAVLIFWLHRANIARLRAGTEPRIGDKKKDEEAPAAPDAPLAAAVVAAPVVVEAPPITPEPSPEA
ncbi:MAG: glycerol-3-phosphate 1-O-acyltransferase PlsY [Caulobacteraceae bacterium]|nr:glycerol-3-phosphate 1-O-acyltransferase PlsY [Caulobacteraceae bacterium]